MSEIKFFFFFRRRGSRNLRNDNGVSETERLSCDPCLPSDDQDHGLDQGENTGGCCDCQILKARIDELMPFVGCDVEIAKLRRLKVMVGDYLAHRNTTFMDLQRYLKDTF